MILEFSQKNGIYVQQGSVQNTV